MNAISNTVRMSLALMILGSFAVSGYAGAQVTPDDEAIAEAVSTELQYSDLVSYSNLRIEVDDGIVSFTGTVPSISSMRQIEDLTATVRGVAGIVNRIEINAPAVPADRLSASVLDALDSNLATELYQLEVSASDDGTVMLDGTVESWTERALAEAVAGNVDGVRAIQNTIEVNAADRFRSVGEIDSEVTELLHWDARVDDSLISVLVREGGRVTLSGTVGSLAEKLLAESLAFVAGVREVDAEQLEVRSWARDEDRQLGVDPDITNAGVRQAIDRALTIDPRVPANSVEIRVNGGQVWLTGQVGSLQAREAAARTAGNTRGVASVNNLLTVQPVTSTDAQLRQEIMAAVASLNERIEIGVTVVDSQARVFGDVEDTEMYRRIAELVPNIRGVESFINDLTVRGMQPRMTVNAFMATTRILMPKVNQMQAPPADRVLYQEVESELFWSPFVDEDAVSIEVDDREVTLTGTVDSMNESNAARDNAFDAGALVVNNELEIQ